MLQELADVLEQAQIPYVGLSAYSAEQGKSCIGFIRACMRPYSSGIVRASTLPVLFASLAS